MSELYDIKKYNEEDLLQMLDLNNPTDRELEAKILQIINQYNEITTEEGKKIKAFFEDVYNFFFTDVVEGFEAGETKDDSDVPEQEEKDENLVQTTSLAYSTSQLNPLLKETQKRVLQLDSQFRNYQIYPSSTDYMINLSEPLNQAVSLRLHSVSVPYTWYNVSNVYNANFFRLSGNVDGLTGVYDLKFEIPAGSYDKPGLVAAVNSNIAEVAAANRDIEFGTTGFTYDINTSKVTFTIDIQQIYNETNYYIYFGNATNPFNENTRRQTISGFLGFGFMVIPNFLSSNADYNNGFTLPTRVESTYSLESIYSDFQSSLNATGITTPSGVTPVLTNSYDPNTLFYLVIDDEDNSGNNFFTIFNYEGPDNYDASSTILDTIRIDFGDASGLYTRGTLLELINRSLLSNEFLSNNSFLHQFDISYNNTDGSITTLQRFQMMVLLNRTTTTKQLNSKQIVIFPNEDIVYSNLDASSTILWSGSLWTGENSCFMFTLQNLVGSELLGGYIQPFNQPNNVKGEVSPVQTLYNLTSEPTLTLRCNRTNYDNNSNNRRITLTDASNAGYIDGYTLNNYIGIYNYTQQYKRSEINTQFSNIRDMTDGEITNGYVNASAFYDVGINRARIQFDILTYFNETDYILDLTNCFLETDFSIAASNSTYITTVNGNDELNIDDIANNEFTVVMPTSDFPFRIDANNKRIIVKPKSSSPGLAQIPNYTIDFPEGSYRTQLVLIDQINKTFSQIQGVTDPNETELNNLNMVQTKIISTLVTDTYTFKYIITNKLSQDDYIVELDDATTNYENDYIDVNGNNRYYLELNTDADGNATLNETTGTQYNYANTGTTAITGTSWNAFLGFTDVSYSLTETREIVASRNVMVDISKTMIVQEGLNNQIFFIPQSSVKGLSDSSGVKRITLSLPQGIYTDYTLYNQINSDLSGNSQLNNSIVYSTFEKGLEYTVFQTCINQVYTAEDYKLIFYDASSADTMVLTSITANSFSTTTWDVTIGWLLGFRSYPTFDLNESSPNNNTYVLANNYAIDSSSSIITLIGDAPIDLYLFKNLYLILDDFTQNHLTDGVITGLREKEFATRPSYSSAAERVENLETGALQSSIFNAVQPGLGLTANQLFAANQISQENAIKIGTKLYSDPPYVKDMFALIPIKVSGLEQGEVFVEYGGTLQDNDRKYFGPVNITKLRVQLLNDHGDIVNLNGANWSFSFVCEYLYNIKGV